MSEPTPVPPSLDLDHLRKQAKVLLRACRASDAAALERVRARLGERAAQSDRDIAETLQLADAQQALALELGHENWAALKDHVLAARPVSEQAERFLAAIREQDHTLVLKLLREHPGVARQSAYAAAGAGDAETLAGAVTIDPDVHGWTSLQYACASRAYAAGATAAAGARRCVELLLAAGADPNTSIPMPEGVPGSTLPVLYYACVAGHAAVVQLLLERGADPNDGESIYHAAELNHRDCLALLLKSGASLSGRHEFWGNTPLYFLAGYSEVGHQVESATAGMEWLLEHGADPNVPSQPSGETPLHRLVLSGRSTAVIEMFLGHGANPGLARKDGRTPYVLAVRRGSVEVAELLAARGGRTPDLPVRDRLIGALMRGELAEASGLLAELPGGISALAAEDRHALPLAASEGREPAVRAMVELGFDLAWEGDGGGTALHWAAWWGLVPIARWLIEHGAPIDLRDATYGSSPLGWAAHGSKNCRSADDDYIAVIDLLVAARANQEAAINRWNDAPAELGSRRVSRHLEALGYVRRHPST